jgi:hypothetical protein
MAEQPPQSPLTLPPAAGGPVRPAGKSAASRSLARRGVALVRRWARDTFSREQLLSSLKALAWVAPLTLLIWIYAEREQQVPGTSRIKIVVKSDDETQVARIVGDDTITATLRGPKARLDEAKDKLDPRSGEGPVQIVIDGNRSPGVHEIDIVAQIEKDYRLAAAGVSVTELDPTYVRVEVDALQEVDLEVTVAPDFEQVLASRTFDPPVVRVTAPASAIQNANAKGALRARANLQSQKLAPGRHGPLKVPVTIEGLNDRSVTVRPPAVSATVEVKQAFVTHKIASLPVVADVSGDMMNNHTIRGFPSFLPNITVYGPADRIQQLQAGTATPKPKARFEVSEFDAGKRVTGRELEYVLPEGIKASEGAPRTIDFELLPKEPN